MAKTTKRITFTATKTFTYTVDMPGWASSTDAAALAAANAPNGSNTLGELLAGSTANAGAISPQGKVTDVIVTAGGSGYASAPTVTFSGGGGTGAAATAVISGGAVVGVVVTNGGSGYTSAPTVTFSAGTATASGTAIISPWTISGNSVTIEQYGMYVNSYAYTTGLQITGTTPTNRLYVCSVAGTTSSSEPTWNQTIGGTTAAGTSTFITVDKFATVATFAVSTAYTAGQIVKPTGVSAAEFVVTVAGTSAASAPTWPTAIGGTVTSGGVTFLCRSIG